MAKIARIKVSLAHVAPAVMRRIEVPFDITLFDLHLVIQSAMPWDNDHLFEFSTSRDNRWGPSDEMFGEFRVCSGDDLDDADDDLDDAPNDDPNDICNLTLEQALNNPPPTVDPAVQALLMAFRGPSAKAATKSSKSAATIRKPATTMNYLYDFGDSWRHTLKIEKIVEAEPGVSYPRLVAAEGRCPPEDCGGAGGYADILDELADPRRRRFIEDSRFAGFDPNTVDMEKLVSDVAAGGAVLTPLSETSAPAEKAAQPKRAARKRKAT